MALSKKHNWFWRSNEESRARSKISVLAIVETLLCVMAYWILLLWYGVMWHHWMIIIATPLVLLRSKKSVELGIRLLDDYIDDSKITYPSGKLKSFMFSILLLSLTLLFCWIISKKWLVGPFNLMLLIKAVVIFLASINFSLAISLAVYRKKVFDILPEGIFAIFLSPGVGFGIWMRVTFIKAFASLRFLFDGLNNLPNNWRFTTTCVDTFQPVELVPGHSQFVYGKLIKIQSVKESGGSIPIFIAELIVLPIIIAPVLLWRWSIKSTAWFYLPLLGLQRGWENHEGDDLRVWAVSYPYKKINVLWARLGWISLAFVTISLFSFKKWSSFDTPLEEGTPFKNAYKFFTSLDWIELTHQPWLWFYIPSYALTIWIYIKLDGISKEITVAKADPLKKENEIKILMRAANLRSVLTNVGLATALFYFLSAVDAFASVVMVSKNFFIRWGGSLLN